MRLRSDTSFRMVTSLMCRRAASGEMPIGTSSTMTRDLALEVDAPGLVAGLDVVAGADEGVGAALVHQRIGPERRRHLHAARLAHQLDMHRRRPSRRPTDRRAAGAPRAPWCRGRRRRRPCRRRAAGRARASCGATVAQSSSAFCRVGATLGRPHGAFLTARSTTISVPSAAALRLQRVSASFM